MCDGCALVRAKLQDPIIFDLNMARVHNESNIVGICFCLLLLIGFSCCVMDMLVYILMMIVSQQQVSKLMELSYSIYHGYWPLRKHSSHHTFASSIYAIFGSCTNCQLFRPFSGETISTIFSHSVEPMTTATANQMNYISIKLTTSQKP